MPGRLIAVLVLTVTVLLVGAGSLYAFDRSAQKKIAEGVTVNGVPVGGLTPAQARAKLSAALLKPLDRPVSVRYHGRRFTLTPAAAHIAIDIEGSVDRAMEASNAGNLFSRTWREVRGSPLNTRVDAKVSWDRSSVRRVVSRVQDKLTVEPREASVDLESGKVAPVTSKDGLAVDTRKLRRDIKTALLSADHRIARVRTTVVEPKVSTEDLAKKYPAILVVDRTAFTLTLYKNLALKKTYHVAVGQQGLETPAGLYHIQNKAVNPAWTVPNSAWAGDLAGKVIPGGTPENPLKARWLGIWDGAGIHGTTETGSIGHAASHGCVRMLIPDVIELYDQVPVGAPIYIG